MIVDVKTSWSGERASSQTDGTSGSRGATAVQTVLVDDSADTAILIEASPLIFQLGDQHPGDPFRRCTNQSIDRTSLLLFTVTAQFGMVGVDADGVPAPGLSPLDVRPVIRWTNAETDEPIDEDVNGKVISTFNGEVFDPPVSETFSDKVLTYTRNMSVFNDQFMQSFENKTNSAVFLLRPVGVVLCKRVTADNIIEKGFAYWRVTGEFHFRLQGKMSQLSRAWWKRIRHEGFMVRKNAGAKPTWAEDNEGNKVPVPVLLKSDGTHETNKNNAGWLEFQTKFTADLNTMGLIL